MHTGRCARHILHSQNLVPKHLVTRFLLLAQPLPRSSEKAIYCSHEAWLINLSGQDAQRFVPWAPNSLLQLVLDTVGGGGETATPTPAPTTSSTTPAPTTTAGGCSLSGFFDASCVEFPTTYSYPATYTTRALVTLHPSVESS